MLQNSVTLLNRKVTGVVVVPENDDVTKNQVNEVSDDDDDEEVDINTRHMQLDAFFGAKFFYITKVGFNFI